MAKAKRKSVEPPQPLPPPGEAESAAIAFVKDRLRERHPRVTINLKAVEEGGSPNQAGAEHSDHSGWLARLQNAFGTRGIAFPQSQIAQLVRACQYGDGKLDDVKFNGSLAVIEGANPENEIQAMLAIQMAMTHAAALDVLRRAQRVDQIRQVDSAGNLAVKLLWTFAMQAKTLVKLQRSGEQLVKVVHVHPGAQAVIGDVHTSTGGGGVDENGSQPMQRTNRQPLALQRARECLASTRRGTPCQSPAVGGRQRCRMHGGAERSGAPSGKRNGAYRSGEFTKQAVRTRREVAAPIKLYRVTLNDHE